LNSYRYFDNLLADLRDAWRGLRRDPGFSVLAILIVAAMLTANMVLFAFLDAFFLRPLPIAGAERHMELSAVNERGWVQRQWPLHDVERFIGNHADVLEASYAFAGRRVIVGGTGPQRSYVEVVSPSFFALVRPPLVDRANAARGIRARGSPQPQWMEAPAGQRAESGWARASRGWCFADRCGRRRGR
jgi:hypothetical protein